MSILPTPELRTPGTGTDGSSAPVALVVINGRAEAVARIADIELRTRRAFAEAGSEVEVLLLPPEAIENALRETAASGPEVIFVGGGDGTIATAAGCLRGGRTALGVLPLGTRNHFARDLRIPIDLDEAVASLVRGRLAFVDLGEVNGLVFINNVSIGVYPRALRERIRFQTRLGVGKLTAMSYAMLEVFWRHRLQRLRIRCEGVERELRTPVVLIGNNDYELAPEAPARRERLDSGRLSVFHTGSLGRFRLLWTALRAAVGGAEELPDLEKRLTEEIVVDARRPALTVAVDGEVRELEPPLVFRSVPAALRVRVPEAAP